MGNIFAIGDIHGCFGKLKVLLSKIDIDFGNDTFVFLGDYIDRGPDSYEVVEYLISFKKKCENVVFLKGNHEEMLEKFLNGSDRLSFLYNGGQQTLESYMRHSRLNDGSYNNIPREHIEFFNSLDYYYETEQYIFVHAGLREKVPLDEQKTEDLLWVRRSFIKSDYDFGKRVIFGHTSFSEPLVEPNKIGIDTGAVYGNKLTCVKLPGLEFYEG